jgi:hypothetical protein
MATKKRLEPEAASAARKRRLEDMKAAIHRHAIEEGWWVEDAAMRAQLKMLAAEQGQSVSDMAAEALNLLFAKYHRHC